MITLIPVSCCMACRAIPRNTVLRKLRFSRNMLHPPRLTELPAVALISAASSCASFSLLRIFFRISSASSPRFLLISQRGDLGIRNRPVRNRAVGIMVTSSIILHPVETSWIRKSEHGPVLPGVQVMDCMILLEM